MSDLAEIPRDAMPSDKLARVHAATLDDVPWHDHQAIGRETAGWAFPRTFLDFETIQFAVPRWVGTSPYQQVPFQFSAHVVDADGAIEHRAFLSIDGSDPRRACAEALTHLPSMGAVIAWNASFERSCILSLAEQFEDLGPALRSLADRLVDLLPVARRHYYHRDMRGSWSIKAVLPTLAPELAYENLAGVRNGADAQFAYVEAIDIATSSSRREGIRRELLAYCQRDTEAMVVLLARLLDRRKVQAN